MMGQRLPQIRKALTLTQVTQRCGRPKEQLRYKFSRVIATRLRGIATVVSSDNRDITRHELGDEFGQACIKSFNSVGIARHVSSMAKILVKVHKIGKHQV